MLNKLLGVLFIINFAKSQHGDFFDYVSAPPLSARERNATCIAHDTKYTCDCRNSDEQMFLYPLDGSVYHISISNCKSLIVAPHTISNTQGLRSLSFTNVHNLILQENALEFPRLTSNTPLILEFNNFSVKTIESLAITGNIEEIVFTDGSLELIRPFAFTSLKDRAVLLKFNNVQFNRIEPQAFKKFFIDQFEISNSVMLANLPSKGFYDLEVVQFKIYNTSFKEIHSRAISFKAASKIILSDNHIEKVDGEWLEAPVLENVIIRNNHFGLTDPYAFKALSVHRDYKSSEKMELRFINNTIHQTNIFPLEFNNDFQLILKSLIYKNKFDCSSADRAREKHFFKTHAEAIYFKSNQQQNNYSKLAKILNEHCTKTASWIYIVAGVVSFIVLVLIITSVLVYLHIKKKRKRKLDVVVPEPRTYRETQIILQIENAGLLKTDL